MDEIQRLQERLVGLNAEANDIKDRASAEKRDLTLEEAAQLDAALAAFDRLSGDIDRLQRLASHTNLLTQGPGRESSPEGPAPGPDDDDDPDPPAAPPTRQRSLAPVNRSEPRIHAQLRPRNGGFRSLGEMALSVIQASKAARSGSAIDPRLQHLAAASTYGNEASGADGGFAVPQDFRTDIMVKVLGEDSLLSRCDQVTTSGNTFTFPVDETTPWASTGGIQAYWDGEAAAATQSKPALTEKTVKLNKVRALVPMTEELMSDASGMDAYLRRKAPEVINMKINVAIVQGTGVGQPLGITASPSFISVAAESPQTADTIITLNIMKMYSRMYAPCRGRAVWLVNQDIEPQLFKMSIPGTDNAGNAVSGWGGMTYMPAGGISGLPYATLYGRPIVPTQACETLGDLGDIIFVDMSQYLALLKSGSNPRTETSMHFWFDQDLIAFKFILRVGGIPWWSTSIAARDGSSTYSWAVGLAAR